VELTARINQFRVASRELFNQYFRLEGPWGSEEAWALEERHAEVEYLLFEKMVLEPAGLPYVRYGELNPRVRVELSDGQFAPIMLNRELDSGYWDHPVKEVPRDAILGFMYFFDFDALGYRDHRYVRVQVLAWPSQPDLAGKHALIETQYVRYVEV
jgi:hypothetical protein